MRITYDRDERAKTLAERGLDFEDAVDVFSGATFEMQDTRRTYGENRILCYGHLRGRLVMIGFTARGEDRHVFTMRKANEREKKRFAPYFGV